MRSAAPCLSYDISLSGAVAFSFSQSMFIYPPVSPAGAFNFEQGVVSGVRYI